MMQKYEYLHRFTYLNYNRNEAVEIWKNNIFYPVDLSEVEQGEKLLERVFPEQLKEFYLSLGYGHLTTPQEREEKYHFYNSNEVLPPLVAAHFYRGIIEHQTAPKEEALEYEDHWMALEALDMFEPGDLPFFEIGDSSSFLVMRPHSNKPDTVWSDCGVKIEDSFERFIWRLYHEDPGYYGDIIEQHYQ